MRKHLNILFFLLFVTTVSKAQNIQFAYTYGGYGDDFGRAVTQTYDNGYAVAGATSSIGTGSTDAYIMKTDSMGLVEWQQTFGGFNIDQAYAIQETRDSGLVIAGFTNSFGEGGYDIFVAKTDSIGDTLWTKTYGGDNWDFAYSITETADSGYVIAGGTYSFGNGSEDMYLIKINAVGDTLWTRTYGGNKEEEAKSVKETMNGDLIFTGFTKSFGDSNGDIYTVRTNSSGDTIWTNIYGGIEEDIGMDIIEKSSGICFIGGTTQSAGSGKTDGVALALTSTGTFINETLYGGSEDDGINALVEAASRKRFAVVGYTYSYGWGGGYADIVMYMESAFTGFQSSTIGGNKMDIAQSIQNTNDDAYVICGNSNSFSSSNQIYLIKTDSNGVAPAIPTITITDINEHNSSQQFTLYPNPANDVVYLNFSDGLSQKATITISDLMGRVVYTEVVIGLSNSPIEINTSQISEGVYFIRVENDEFSASKKLIIKP